MAMTTSTDTPSVAAPAATLLQLMWLASPALPVGGFSYSEVLEAAVDTGRVHDEESAAAWLLDQLHKLIGNWGWAIVGLVVLLKIAFYWLNASAYRSMAKMKAINPRVMELRERYKDDRQQLNEKMMELYRTEKINPLGGCLPIVVQIPVFIALYSVLLSTVEMRGAPWATHWLVSARDDAGQLRIALVDPSTSGIQRRDLRLIDGTWAAELAFDNTPVQAVIGQGDAMAALHKAWDTATLVAGAEAVGVMQSLMRDTLAYMNQRKQFGQPLAAFQALQHRLADMYLALVQAAAAVGTCTHVLDDSAENRARRVSSAHVAVLRAARLVGQGAVQLHGGMGMTDELAVGHGFKRLTVIEQQFGGVAQHLRRVAGLSRG